MSSKADTAIALTIGIDTGKNTLHVIGLDERGALVLREKVSRTRIAARFVNVPRCLIGLEAGMASHHIARELVALGHEVKQVAGLYETVPARSQERFPGCAGSCGSSRSLFDRGKSVGRGANDATDDERSALRVAPRLREEQACSASSLT